MPEPRIKHHGCVVDMLDRAGRLDEAEELVAAMPAHPDALIWGSRLVACRAHGDVERAERVMRRRTTDADADAGDYVLMSNTYTSNGRHGEAVKVRRQMRRNEIDKWSWFSVPETAALSAGTKTPVSWSGTHASSGPPSTVSSSGSASTFLWFSAASTCAPATPPPPWTPFCSSSG
uniref:Pentatricopeptide repeat-containing protein n=1 Tax=Oryza rufipogon TaxID=4529 RepID=A0A0E0NYG9_ORYRU